MGMSRKKQVISLICLFFMFFNRFLPPMFGLNQLGTSVLCVFIPTIVLLLSVDLIWPALASILAFAVSGIYTFSGAVAKSFGHTIVWLCVFSGMVISVLDEQGVIRRLALWFISRPIVRKDPWVFVGMLLLATLLIGSITDPTALILIMSVLTEEVVLAAGGKKGGRMGALLMLGVLIMDGISTGITPIGHPIPVMVMDLFAESGLQIDFFRFTISGYVIGLLLLAALLLALRFVFKLDVSGLKNFDATEMYRSMGPMSKRAKVSVVIYLGVILLWLAPGAISGLWPQAAAFLNSMGTTAPLALAVVIMSLVTVDGKPLMNVRNAIANGAPWAACFTVAIALLLGGSLNIPDAGIVDALTEAGTALGGLSPMAFVFIICLLCTLLTNFTSDTLTALLMTTIALSLINSGIVTGVDAGALCVCLCIVDAAAYATPPASAFAAIISGRGWVTPKTQFAVAGGFALIESAIVSLVGYLVAGLIF